MKKSIPQKNHFIILILSLFCAVNYSFAQTISLIAGTFKSACTTSPCGDGGQAIDAKLYSPSGLAIDPQGNIYISEYSNHDIRKIDKVTGVISTFAGTQKSNCITAPCGDGGLATAAKLSSPRGIAFDPGGNLYVTDFSNHAIRRVDKTTGIMTTVAGTLKSACSTSPCGDGGLATSAKMNSPTGLTFDGAGNMFIADYGNNVVRKVDAVTGIMSTVAGTMKTSCSSSPCGDGGAATASQLNGPSGLAFGTDGNLYIAEYNNHDIRMVNMTSGVISTVAGTAKLSCIAAPCGDGTLATSATARLTSPFALTLDPSNNIYVADASNSAIRKIDKTTGIITTVAGILKTSCATAPCADGGLAIAATLTNPFGVAFNSSGELLIIEYSNQVLRKVSSLYTLPVIMTDLAAYKKNNRVEIKWKAANEINVLRYEIERSRNNSEFKKIGEMKALGDGSAEINYNWPDEYPLEGNNFYRLKSIDIDNSFKYSSILQVNFTDKQNGTSVFPNPVASGSLQLRINNSQAGTNLLTLHDAMGKKVFTKSFLSPAGTTSMIINVPTQLNSGTYFLQVSDGKQVLLSEKIFLND